MNYLSLFGSLIVRLYTMYNNRLASCKLDAHISYSITCKNGTNSVIEINGMFLFNIVLFGNLYESRNYRINCRFIKVCTVQYCYLILHATSLVEDLS